MKNKHLAALFFPFLFFLSTGCVSLQRVSNYAATATESVGQFEELSYSFTQACYDRCQVEQLEKNQLLRTGCACTGDERADSVTLVLYTAIKGYFDGLLKLSDKELTNYNYDALQKSLLEGSFGDVKIDKAQVASYLKISRILNSAITGGYRKKKLVQYIEEANEPIQVLLKALEFNMASNLSKKLDVKAERLKSYYFDLSTDTHASAYEKKQVIQEYTATMADIEKQKQQLATYGRGLENIAAGHQALYDNRNKLNVAETKATLTQYSSAIKDVVADFNKRKNQN